MGRVPETTTDDVRECLRERLEPCEPTNAPEVGRMLDCSATTAREHLNILVEHGEIRRKELSDRNVVYWRRDG